MASCSDLTSAFSYSVNQGPLEKVQNLEKERENLEKRVRHMVLAAGFKVHIISLCYCLQSMLPLKYAHTG